MKYRELFLAFLVLVFLAWLLQSPQPTMGSRTIIYDQNAYVGNHPALLSPSTQADRNAILEYLKNQGVNSAGQPLTEEQLRIVNSYLEPTKPCYQSILLKAFPDSVSDRGAKSYFIPSGPCGNSEHIISYHRSGGWGIS